MGCSPGQDFHPPTVGQTQDYDLFARHKRLTDWILENGGYLHPDVEIAHTLADGYHVVVSKGKTIMRRTRISSCPMTCTLSVLNALNIMPFSDRGTKFPKSFLESNIDNRELLQAFFLMEQSVLGEKSWWAPFINTLPTVDDVNSLQFDTTEDMKWIRGTNLETGYQELMSRWKGHYEKGLKELRTLGWSKTRCDAYTWELYRWAANIFGSRGFSSVVLSDTAPSEQARIGANFGHPVEPYVEDVFAERFGVLLPMLDVSNHNPKSKVDWQPRTSFVGLQVRETYGEGEQIFNNYGPKDNESLLLSYGFVSEDRSFQHVALSLRVPPGTLLDAVRKWPPDGRSNPEHNLYILNTDHFKTPTATCVESALFDYDLLDTLSVLMANERECQAMINSRKTLMSTSLSKPHAFDDFRNLLAVLGQILVHCKKGRARLISTRPDGEPNGTKQSNATILRDQQISHYGDAIRLCEVVLTQACRAHVGNGPVTEIVDRSQSELDEHSCRNVKALFERHDRITRSGELFSTPCLLDMLSNGTKPDVEKLLDAVGRRICSFAQPQEQPQILAQCRVSLCLSVALQAYPRSTTISQRLANWLEQAVSRYPPDDDSWAYVPTSGPWPPGEEPPAALQFLLRAASEHLNERRSGPAQKAVNDEDDANLSPVPDPDLINQWLKPKSLCWAYNVMNEETLQVPMEIARFSHELYQNPHSPESDPMDVMLYMNSQ